MTTLADLTPAQRAECVEVVTVSPDEARQLAYALLAAAQRVEQEPS